MVKKILKIFHNPYAIFLFILCLILFISHTVYVLQTHQYPQQDEHVYLAFATQFLDIVHHPSRDAFLQIIEVNRYRQPLYGLFLTCVLFFTGTAYTYKIVLWLNVLFYLITVISIYFLGKEFMSKKASVLAAYIFAFYGFPLFYLHFTYSETAVTAFTILPLLFLAKSKNLSNRKYTIFFSIFFLLGGLTRWVVPLFISGSFVDSLIHGVFRQYKKKTRNIQAFAINISLVVLIGILPAVLILYGPNIFYFRKYISQNVAYGPQWMQTIVHPDLPGIQNAFSIHSVMFYFNILSEQTIFFFFLFVVGFLHCLRHVKHYGFFLFGFIFPYCIFTFASVLKFDRYIVPLYPMMALCSAVTFDYLKNKKVKLLLVAITIIFGFLNFLGSSWAIGPMGRQGLKDIVMPSFFPHPRRIYLTPMVWPPRPEELNAEKMFTIIQKDFAGKNRIPFILQTFQYSPYNNAMYTIVAYEKRNIFSYTMIFNEDYLTLFQNLNRSDYMLVKDKNPIDIYYNNPQSSEGYTLTIMMRKFNNVLEENPSALQPAFERLAVIPLPLDKSNIIVYKKNEKITRQDFENFGMLLEKQNPEDMSEIENAMNTVYPDKL